MADCTRHARQLTTWAERAAWLAQIGAQIGKIVLLYASKAASALIETGSQQRTQKYTGLFNALELLRSTRLADTAHTTAAQFMCALRCRLRLLPHCAYCC